MEETKQRQGRSSALEYGLTETALGWVAVAGGPGGICRSTLPQPGPQQAVEHLQSHGRPVALERDDGAFAAVLEALRRYCAGAQKELEFPLDLSAGTAFQQRVWETTRAIPYGSTLSYGDVAYEAGCPRGARAVGAAMGSNPVPLFVPCHRVIGSDGSLHGYGGGLPLKRRLLDLEGAKGARGTDGSR
jgi:O-6-methylguanine DNA methyltransferase